MNEIIDDNGIFLCNDDFYDELNEFEDECEDE